MSVVTGDDIIPRLSVRSVHALKADILKELRNCQLAKYQVIWKYSVSFVSSTPQFRPTEEFSDEETPRSVDEDDSVVLDLDSSMSRVLVDSVQSRTLMPSSIAPLRVGPPMRALMQSGDEKTALSNLSPNTEPFSDTAGEVGPVGTMMTYATAAAVETIVSMQQVRRMIENVHETYPEMAVPGNVLYIYRMHESNADERSSFCDAVMCCRRTMSSRRRRTSVAYDFRWASRDEFKKILITNRTIMDHLPDSVEEALRYFATSTAANNSYIAWDLSEDRS